MAERCQACGRFYNPKKGHKCQAIKKEEIEKAISWYYEGISISEIAKRLNRPFEPIRRLLHKKVKLRHSHLRSKTIEIPDEVSLSYAAGFFDGEGYVNLVGHKYKDKNYFVAQLHIDNTNSEVIKWFRDTFHAGSIYVKHAKDSRHKTCYTWFLTRQIDILILLKSLLPYLKVKKTKAQEIIRFLEEKIYG